MKNGEQSAFGFGYANESSHHHEAGLTKREYFIAKAMQGMLSNPNIIDTDNWEWIATNAIKQADEILKQLESNIQP